MKMKDQMYLYGFLVVTSIVALILSVLSLTKKDKFSDYTKLKTSPPFYAEVRSGYGDSGDCKETLGSGPANCHVIFGGTTESTYELGGDEATPAGKKLLVTMTNLESEFRCVNNAPTAASIPCCPKSDPKAPTVQLIQSTKEAGNLKCVTGTP